MLPINQKQCTGNRANWLTHYSLMRGISGMYMCRNLVLSADHLRSLAIIQSQSTHSYLYVQQKKGLQAIIQHGDKNLSRYYYVDFEPLFSN